MLAMEEFIINMVEESNRAILVYRREKAKTLYANKLAVSLYGDVDGTVNIEQLLMSMNQNPILLGKARETMEAKGVAFLYNFMTRSIWGEEKLSDIQMGYADQERTQIYMELTMKDDNRLERAKQQLDRSHKAEAILEFDTELSIVYCNQAFYRLFDTTEKEFMGKSTQFLSQYFLPERKEKTLAEIQKELRRNRTFYMEAKLETHTGEKKEISIDFQHCNLDASGRKLLVSCDVMDELMIRASKYLKFHSLVQYFEGIQALSGDAIFLVDVKERLLIHKGREDLGLPELIHHFPESIYHFIHPEEIESFKDFVEKAFHGTQGTHITRLKRQAGEYCNYQIIVIGISDDCGEVMEILGKVTRI